MTRKEKKYRLDLKAILGMYGVTGKLKDEFLDRFLTAIEEQQADQILGYAKQLSKDAFMITMREQGHGPVKCRKLLAEFEQKLAQFDVLAEDEAIDNIKNENLDDNGFPEIIYTKELVDRAVRPLYGEDMLPYDKRYSKAQDEEEHHNWDELRKMAEGA